MTQVSFFDGLIRVNFRKIAFFGKYFKVEELIEQHQYFDGSMSDPYCWQISRRKPFVTVLIYIVPTDEIVLVEQFRPATMKFEDLAKNVPYKQSGRTLELVAGGIGNDTPEQCARREALEEAGYKLDQIFKMPGAFLSPGGTDEYGFLFFAPVMQRDPESGQGGGLREENEDIRVHLIKFRDALAMVMSGEIVDLKTQAGILLGEKFRKENLVK